LDLGFFEEIFNGEPDAALDAVHSPGEIRVRALAYGYRSRIREMPSVDIFCVIAAGILAIEHVKLVVAPDHP
jgi:hypothetical protein